MRRAGLRLFAAAVLTLALLSSTVVPLAAFARPMLSDSSAASDAAGSGSDLASSGPGRTAATGPIDWARRLLEEGGADYSQLLGLAPASGAGLPTGMDEPSLLVIPEVVLAAYRNAARSASSMAAGCTLDWPVLAGIGRVESRHGLFGGAETVIDTQGNIAQLIVGPPLNGDGVATIPDSDRGRWDGDHRWDRAVGLMQFIPSSWRRFGQDGNGDGISDPQNVFDATLAAVKHLCGTQGGDLRDDARLERALFAYNRSDEYVADVRRWIDIYRNADPTDLVPAPALQTAEEGRLNPFSNLLSTVAFDGSLPTGPLLGRGPGLSTAPTPTAISGPSPSLKSSPSPKASPSPKSSPSPSPKASPSPSSSPKASSPKASPSPSSSPKASPSPSPSPKASPSPSPTPSPSPSPSPSPKASPSPSPSPKASPSPSPSPTPSPSPSPSPSPKASPSPSPSPSPKSSPSPSPPPEDPPSTPPDPAPAPSEPAPAPEPAPEPTSEPAPAPEPAPEPTSEAAPEPKPEPEECPSPDAATEPPPADECEPPPAP